MKETEQNYDTTSWNFWEDAEVLEETDEEMIWGKGDWRCACQKGVFPGDADSQIWRVRHS